MILLAIGNFMMAVFFLILLRILKEVNSNLSVRFQHTNRPGFRFGFFDFFTAVSSCE